MEQALEHLQHELAGVRTGRAQPGLIENILVDAHGEHMPVKACGTVTVRNPQLLAVSLYDAEVGEGVGGADRHSKQATHVSALSQVSGVESVCMAVPADKGEAGGWLLGVAGLCCDNAAGAGRAAMCTCSA